MNSPRSSRWNRRRLAALAVMCVLALGVSVWVATQGAAQSAKIVEAAPQPEPITINPNTPPELADAIINGLKGGSLRGVKFKDVEGLREFYRENNITPLWMRSVSEPNSDAKAALALLETAWTHGLNPLTYNADKIRALIDNKDAENRTDLELLLSEGVVRYGRDLTGMRVSPASVGQTGRYWQPPMRGADILKWVAKNKGSAKNALEKLAPQGELYQRLRHELVTALASTETPRKPVRFTGNLKPRSSHDAVATMRDYLGVKTIPPEGPRYYDDALAAKVMAFQEEHGIAPDGIVGPSTQKIFNMTRLDKINQLVANLERQRWMDRVKPPKYVMVNIPSATLWAVEKGSSPMQMKVIVGRETRPTNSFKATITGVRFNPTWTVPPTIKKEDYLPKLIEDPEYLAKRGIDIRYQGKSIDPTTVDWATLPWEQAQNLTMVQNTGATNPLGRVRVLMPNNYNIYLHDTNDRSVFARNSRGLSSGCIRVEKPEELANFILKENDGWSTQAMEGLFSVGKTRDIATQTPIPVYLVYNTIWEKQGGKLVYGSDLYGMDDQLMGAIRKINGYQAPENVAEIAGKSGFQSAAGLD